MAGLIEMLDEVVPTEARNPPLKFVSVESSKIRKRTFSKSTDFFQYSRVGYPTVAKLASFSSLQVYELRNFRVFQASAKSGLIAKFCFSKFVSNKISKIRG